MKYIAIKLQCYRHAFYEFSKSKLLSSKALSASTFINIMHIIHRISVHNDLQAFTPWPIRYSGKNHLIQLVLTCSNKNWALLLHCPGKVFVCWLGDSSNKETCLVSGLGAVTILATHPSFGSAGFKDPLCWWYIPSYCFKAVVYITC